MSEMEQMVNPGAMVPDSPSVSCRHLEVLRSQRKDIVFQVDRSVDSNK